MSTAWIIAFIKSILPTKKIAAWILGIIGAGVALFMGVNNSDLKAQFCASEIVDLPKVEVPAIGLPEKAPESK